MFADLNPSAELPSRKTFSRLVESSNSDKLGKIKNKLSSLSHVCTTADIWSTRHRSFMGVTAHWVCMLCYYFFLIQVGKFYLSMIYIYIYIYIYRLMMILQEDQQL